jgi:hypothetical protein
MKNQRFEHINPVVQGSPVMNVGENADPDFLYVADYDNGL